MLRLFNSWEAKQIRKSENKRRTFEKTTRNSTKLRGCKSYWSWKQRSVRREIVDDILDKNVVFI